MDIDKYEKTIYELRQLLEVTKVLNSTLHFKKLVDSILFSFMAQARCVKAALFIGKEIDPEMITLQRNYMGFDITPIVPIQINCRSEFFKQMAMSRKCSNIKDLIPQMVNISGEFKKYLVEHVELIIPLVINKKIAGLVVLGGRIDSDVILKSELNFLSEIGVYASIAIQNAILFDMATMDMMTELKVRHYILKFMEECISLGDHKFVILMIDIDNFKNVNDTYGHQTGDETIIGISKIIKQTVRNHDIASRFGGEEFVIMLREVDIDGAMLVAERIRKRAEELQIKAPNGMFGVTISIGVAEFDSDLDKTADDVIGRADEAMYISKNGGKNRITTA